MRRASKVATVVLAGIAAMAGGARWHRRWGATDEEVAEPLPGDGLVPVAGHKTTRAITILCPPEVVWPWLVQMGQGRGGFYTYEWVENVLGARIQNLDRIDPDLQELHVGDLIRLTPEVYLGRLPGQFYRVEEIRPGEALTMLQELPGGGTSSWSLNRSNASGRPDSTIGAIEPRVRRASVHAWPDAWSCCSSNLVISSWSEGCSTASSAGRSVPTRKLLASDRAPPWLSRPRRCFAIARRLHR